MVLAAAAIVAALVAALAWLHSRPTTEERFQSPPLELVYVHMDGCRYCELLTPEWEAFERQHGAALRAAGVHLRRHESASPEARALREHVSGYPTVLLMSGPDVRARFAGERTSAGLAAFLREQGVAW